MNGSRDVHRSSFRVHTSESVRPNLPLIATVLSWGFNFVALKLMYEQMSPPAVGLVRFVIMWAALVLLCQALGYSIKYPKGDAGRLMFQGFLAMGAYMWFFLEGMRGSTAAEGAIILATAPIFTAFFAALAGQERFNPRAMIGAVVAFIGVGMVVATGAHEVKEVEGKWLANGLVLVASAVWALTSVVSRPLVEKYVPLRVLTLSMPGGLLVMLPYGLAPTLAVDWGSLSAITWAMMLHMAVLAGVVGFAGFYTGIKQIGAPAAMLYQYLVPPIAALSAWIVFGQSMMPLQFVGLSLVLAGVWHSMHCRFQASRQVAACPIEGA